MLLALVMTPVSSFTWLRNSLPYLVAISMFALVLSEFSAWQGARAEEAATDAEDVAREVLRLLREEGVI
jgi:hypothetical protein